MRKVLIIPLCVMLVLSSILIFPVNATEPEAWDGKSISSSLGGAGSEADPYLISSGADLALMRHEINNGNAAYTTAYYSQTRSIGLGGFRIDPIGPTNTATAIFKGNYDGGGFTISDFVINTDARYAGLFGYIAQARIEGIKVSGASVASSSTASSGAAGIVAGYINTGSYVGGCETAADCYIEADGTSRIGGVVGWNYTSTIEYCLNRATVIYRGNNVAYVGGITGTLGQNDALISNCVNTGTVIANSSANGSKVTAGGIVGLSGGSSGTNTVTSCYNAGVVANINADSSGDVDVGGLCGQNNKAQTTFFSCYNTGAVYTASASNTKNYIGSLIGYIKNEAHSSSYCYSLTQQGIKAFGDSSTIASVGLTDSLTSVFSGIGGSMTSLGAVLGVVDTALARELGITCDWSKESYDNSQTAALTAIVAAGDMQSARAAVLSAATGTDTLTYTPVLKLAQITPVYRKESADIIDIRFISVIASLDYSAIGFTVTVNEYPAKRYESRDTKVYATLTGRTDGGIVEKSAGDYGDGRYLSAISIKGVPAGETLHFIVTPYVVLNDNTTRINGTAYSIEVINGVITDATAVN